MAVFFLAIISRGLTAGQKLAQANWSRKSSSASVVVTTQDNGRVKVVTGEKNARIWRTSVDFPRSLLQMVISGVNYLLYRFPLWGGAD